MQAQAVGNVSDFTAAQLAEAMEAFALAGVPCSPLANAVKSAIRSETSRYQQQDSGYGEDNEGYWEGGAVPAYDQDGLRLMLDAASSSPGQRVGFQAVAEAVQEALELMHPEPVEVAAT